MPVLKIKRVFVQSIYNSLKNTPPKDYPTTGEIKDTINGVLPALKEHIQEYHELFEEAEGLSLKVATKEVTEEEGQKLVDEINARFKAYNKEHGNDIVEVKFTDEGFKTIRTQFEREGWGAKWTANLEEFDEVMTAFADAAKKSDKKKAKKEEDEEAE